MQDKIICPNCGGNVKVRNPTLTCDHLCWPDYLTNDAKKKIGTAEIDRIQAALMGVL